MIKLLFLCGCVACGIILSIVWRNSKSQTSKNEPWQLSFHFPVDTSPLLLNSTVSVSVCLCVNFDCKYLFYISTLAGPRPGADMQKIADIRIGCRAAAADKASTQLWQCQQPCNEWRKKIFLSPTSYSGSKTDIQIVEHDHTLSDEEMTLHQFINGLKTRRYNIYTLYSKVKVVSKERKSIVTLSSCKRR